MKRIILTVAMLASLSASAFAAGGAYKAVPGTLEWYLEEIEVQRQLEMEQQQELLDSIAEQQQEILDRLNDLANNENQD